jgi:hypothetical protein
MEFLDDVNDRGLSGNTIARALGPIPGIAYNVADQKLSTSASKLIPGVSWFKGGRNATRDFFSGSGGDDAPQPKREALGRIGN